MVVGTSPSLRTLCMAQLGDVYRQLNGGIASCDEQARSMDKRKKELLVELGAISDALEELHQCRTTLCESRDDFLEDLASTAPEVPMTELLEKLRAAAPAPTPATEPAPLAPGPAAVVAGGDAPEPTAPEPQAARLNRSGAARASRRKARAEPGAAGGRGSAEEKARRLAAILPADEAERAALLRRQIAVCELPAGSLDESKLAAVIRAALSAVPDFDTSAGEACCRVQMYGGGTYAFVTLREEALARTALEFPRPILVCGKPMRLARPRGVEPLVGVTPLAVPPDWSLPDATEIASEVPADASTKSNTTLESKLYWSLRQADSPKPNEKEARESLAFFKQTNKLLKRKRLIIDVCGSHGLIGGLFVGFGKAVRRM